MTRSARFALAAVAAGALAALLVVGAPAGLNLVLVALALAAAAAFAGGGAHPVRSALLGALALALAASAALRDAGWVVAGELALALALGSIATSAPSRPRAIALGSIAAVLRMASGARRVFDVAVGGLPRATGGQVLVVGRALLLTGVLLTIFGMLFAAGDRAFAQLAGDVLPDELPVDEVPLRLVVFGLVTSLAGGLAQAATLADRPAGAARLRLGRAEWLLALGALNALFGLFVGVQLAVLFGGDGYVLRTAGLTYAEYAREGFAQLVVVAVLTLAVIAGALRWARTDGARQGRLLRALLAVLCVLTLVVLASALHRLGLYEEAYGFTRTRLAVHALLLFVAALFVLVIAALAAGSRDWLGRATVSLAAVGALAFWVSDPDRRIAAHNVERWQATGRIDVDYLSRLSADAVPVLTRLPPALRDRALRVQRGRLARDADGLAGANRARTRARGALAALPAP